MRLSETLCNKIGSSSFVSITGGGGKTSLMCLLQKSLLERGRTVLLTTTTKVQRDCDWNVSGIFSSSDEIPQGCMSALLARPFDDRKLCFAGEAELKEASRLFDITLCEADGSRGLPVKIHTDRDPVIFGKTDLTIAVFGCSGLGKRTDEAVFGETSFEYVDEAFLSWYFRDPQGIMKGKPDIVVMNQCEDLSERQLGILNDIEYPKGVDIFFSSVLRDELYRRKN